MFSVLIVLPRTYFDDIKFGKYFKAAMQSQGGKKKDLVKKKEEWKKLQRCTCGVRISYISLVFMKLVKSGKIILY